MRGKTRRWIRYSVLPAFLTVFSPPTAILIWYTNVVHHGSLLALGDEFVRAGIIGTVARVWRPVFFGSRTAWMMIAIYAAVELAMMKLLPGRKWSGHASRQYTRLQGKWAAGVRHNAGALSRWFARIGALPGIDYL